MQRTDDLVVRLAGMLYRHALLAVQRSSIGYCTGRHREREAGFVLLDVDRYRDTPFAELLDLLAVAEETPGHGEDEIEGYDHDDDPRDQRGLKGRTTLRVGLNERRSVNVGKRCEGETHMRAARGLHLDRCKESAWGKRSPQDREPGARAGARNASERDVSTSRTKASYTPRLSSGRYEDVSSKQITHLWLHMVA